MAYFLSPVLNEQQFDANGNPRAGALISTYLAGTLTAVTTYKTSSGTAHTNPIQLDSSGNYPNGTQLWLLGGFAYKFVITDSDGSNSRTYDNISGIGDNPSSADEWIVYGGTVTYISPTSFSVAGDQTNTFQVLRRLKSTNTGGTVYSTISASVFAAGNTTVTVSNTSGVLDSGLSQVSYGLLSATNPSIPETATGTLLRTATNANAARAVIGQVGTRQTILAGAAAFLQIGTGLAVNILATATPLRLSFANGMNANGEIDYVESYTADTASVWSGLTPSTTNYLFFDRNSVTGALTGASSILPYIVQDSAAAISVVNNQHTYVYDVGQMYVGNGATATAVQRTAAGECVTSGVAVTSVTPYAKQRRYVSANQAIPAAGTAATVQHNIGVPSPLCGSLMVYLRNTVGNLNYIADDMVPYASSVDNGTLAQTPYVSRLAAGINGTYASIALANKTTGVRGGITDTNWRFVFIIDPVF